MTADLVPVDNMAALDTMDAEHREVAVTTMLSEARSWLAHAVEATEPRAIADFKSYLKTVAETAKQLHLSKEIQIDAFEMVRRAERGVGKAIRHGQEEGAIETTTEGRQRATAIREVNQGRADQSVVNDLIKPRPTDFATKDELSGNSAGIYHLTDNVSDEQFEEAIAEAKAEKNMSRENVVRKAKHEPRPTGDRHELLRKTRRADSNKIIDATVHAASIPTSALDLVDYTALDRTHLHEWISSLSESITTLRALRSRLQKELSTHGES